MYLQCFEPQYNFRLAKMTEKNIQMNGLEKIDLANKFDTLLEDKKQELYDKYGQDTVEEEIKRCRLVELIKDNDIKTLDQVVVANDFVELFTNNKAQTSNQIMKDIKKMLSGDA